MRRAIRAAIAVAVLFGLVAGSDLLIRLSNGDFSGDYALSGLFPRAGEGLQTGSEVVFRGVQVGRVSGIALDGTQAEITVLVDPDFRVPADATATVEPVNLFGAEQVTVTAPLLERVNTMHLASVIAELAQASDGEGSRIAAALDQGTRLAGMLDATLDAQLQALDAFARFADATAGDGGALNGLSAQENAALPAFNRDAAAYQRLLDNLTPFSHQLATLLADYHPDIATLLADGDNVARVLTAQQEDLGQVVRGAYQYLIRFADASNGMRLPDGSQFAYFNTFILFSDVNTLVCDLIAPAEPGLSFLEPLQQAIAGAGTPFDCSSQLSAFDAAQAQPVPAVGTTAAAPLSPTSPAAAAAEKAATDAYGVLGAPQPEQPTSVGTYVEQLLGGIG